MPLLKAHRFSLLAAAAIAAGASTTSQAATSGGTLAVTATVASVCLISNGTLAFGTYDPSAGTVLNGSATITLTCTLGTPYKITMGAGAGSGATTTVRKLTNGANTLSYSLYRDAARTQNWGDTLDTDSLNGTSSAVSLTNTISVYGQIPAGEAVPGGAYMDSVAITVNY